MLNSSLPECRRLGPLSRSTTLVRARVGVRVYRRPDFRGPPTIKPTESTYRSDLTKTFYVVGVSLLVLSINRLYLSLSS